MRKIREVLRLKLELNLSDRLVGQSVQLARSTVQDYVARAQQAGLSWPLPPELDDVQLEALLFRTHEQAAISAAHQPDWAAIDRELRRKGVTRQLLWEEYRRQHPDGWQYATFNENYRKWKATTGLTLRQTHRAGEKLFVDYAGLTLALTDPRSGAVQAGQVFVATLGASEYTYAEVSRTQGVHDWIGSHIRALDFFGGVPEIIVPDNLKAGVTHATPLRTRAQPHLPGVRAALRRGRHPGAGPQAQGQGPGGSARADRGTPHSGPPTRPGVLQPIRGERSRPGTAGRPESAAFSETVGQSPQ